MNGIKRVLIAGGTHGNELIGVNLIKKFERSPDLVCRPSFETEVLLANPRSVTAGTRYIDKDLNRCFSIKDTELTTELAYEAHRAKALRDEFGQAGQTPVDFIIDLHSTTSNAKLMLILDNLDALTLNLAAHLSSIQPNVKIYHSGSSGRKQDALRSLAQYRLGIEVGPVAHGTLDATLFRQTEELVYQTLDYLEQYNRNKTTARKSSLILYQYVGTVDYPRDARGELLGMIHPQLQFNDYEALNPGDPMFITVDGAAMVYQEESTVYPVFINEAAYYEKGIAMYLTRKQQIETYQDATA